MGTTCTHPANTNKCACSVPTTLLQPIVAWTSERAILPMNENEHFTLFEGMDAFEVVTKFLRFGQLPEAQNGSKRSIDVSNIVPHLYWLHHLAYTEQLKDICVTIEKILSNPSNFPSIHIEGTVKSIGNLRHAHVLRSNEILIFLIAQDTPNNVKILWMGEPQKNIKPSKCFRKKSGRVQPIQSEAKPESNDALLPIPLNEWTQFADVVSLMNLCKRGAEMPITEFVMTPSVQSWGAMQHLPSVSSMDLPCASVIPTCSSDVATSESLEEPTNTESFTNSDREFGSFDPHVPATSEETHPMPRSLGLHDMAEPHRRDLFDPLRSLSPGMRKTFIQQTFIKMMIQKTPAMRPNAHSS